MGHDTAKSQRGAALIEASIMLILLLTLSFGTLSLGARYRTQLTAINYAQTAAQLLYRQCGFRQTADIPACIESTKSSLLSAAAAQGLAMDYILSVYQDSVSTESPYNAPFLLYTTGDSDLGITRFNVDSFANATPERPIAQMFQSHGRTWVAESFIRKEALFFGLGGGVAYENSFL